MDAVQKKKRNTAVVGVAAVALVLGGAYLWRAHADAQEEQRQADESRRLQETTNQHIREAGQEMRDFHEKMANVVPYPAEHRP